MIELTQTKRTDNRLLERMKIHYSQPRGFVGRNICYAVTYKNVYYGHIVAGSATRFLPGRNEFLDSDLTWLNNIVNNIFYNVSRIDNKYPTRNFTSEIIKHFVNRVIKDWQQKYNDEVIGFESLIEKPRTGECYKRAGWTLVGETKGISCKKPATVIIESTIDSVGVDRWGGKRIWDTTNLKPKLVYCLRIT